MFFHSLAMIACIRRGQCPHTTRYFSQISLNQAFLRTWSVSSPINTSHWVTLVVSSALCGGAQLLTFVTYPLAGRGTLVSRKRHGSSPFVRRGRQTLYQQRLAAGGRVGSLAGGRTFAAMWRRRTRGRSDAEGNQPSEPLGRPRYCVSIVPFTLFTVSIKRFY